MKNPRIRIAGLSAAATTALALLAAPAAQAGPDVLGNAQDVINSIRAQEGKVVITKIGNKPLTECVATSVREDLAVFGSPRVYPNISSGPTRRVLLYRVYHVDVEC